MSAHHRHGAGEKIWLTPPWLIEMLGPFDLDPCFSEPRPWATAAEHYGPDAADGLGGLHAKWRGFVWCNPPYDERAGQWLARCAEHGNALALVFARTETAWFVDAVWRKASAVFFLAGRLHFYHPDGREAKKNSGAPSVLVAYGETALERIQVATARGRIKGQLVDLRAQRVAA